MSGQRCTTRPAFDLPYGERPPEGCVCLWEPYIPRDVHTGQAKPMRRRIEEVMPYCDVHGTDRAREALKRAERAAFIRAGEKCCGVPLEWATCPKCRRTWTSDELYERRENPVILPSSRVAAGGSPLILGPSLEVIADDRLF